MPESFGRIPWKHHVLIFTKSKSLEEALFYINMTIEHNWSRRILEDNISAKLFETRGAAITNFKSQLPLPQGELAQEILKDPYNFNFLTIQEGYNEKEFIAVR